MTTTTHAPPAQNRAVLIPEDQRGPAERLLDLILTSGPHLWHNRPGLNQNGTWVPARRRRGAPRPANLLMPGLFVPAAVNLYRQLLDIYRINAELAARFASYVMLNTEHRDLKVACAALMLVQPKAGLPIRNEAGEVEFYDDDYRAVGQGMVLFYEKGPKAGKGKRKKGEKKAPEKHMNPKTILRIVEFLETPQIAEMNRQAGFGDPTKRQAFRGRWDFAAIHWLRSRELNLPLLKGLVDAGFKTTVRQIARKCGYRPQTQKFYEIIGWEQKQSSSGHRSIGLVDLKVAKRQRFDGLTEEQICQRIVEERLQFKDVMGRLPKEIGLTPAIMVACLPSLSDRDVRILTPTLEELGLLSDPAIRARWEKAISTATDQRALNIAKNVQSKELREKLEGAADNAVKKAVEEATKDVEIEVLFLIDKSGSMEHSIAASKEALTRILAGFPEDKIHIASFDTIGTVLKPKSPTRAGVQHMLAGVVASGGTDHASGVRAIHRSGFRPKPGAHLIVIVAGDEGGESPTQFAASFEQCGYQVAAFGMIVALGPRYGRGQTVKGAAQRMGVPFTEIDVSQFDDPYAVPRVLKALLEAPVLAAAPAQQRVARAGLVEKIMSSPLLAADGTLIPVAKAQA